MKKIIKGIFSLIMLVVILCCIAFGIYVYQGYEMYQNALSEKSMEDRISEIRDASDYLTLDKIPKVFKDAIIAVEDHRFESHGAVDFISIGRAITRNITNMSFAEGGSTITQQFEKNTFFTQEGTLKRKIAEIFAAIDLEKAYSKDEIIEMYMNTIYFGDGYYGINQASHGYFNKDPLDLTFDEATLLAGLPNAPSVYSLTTNPDLAEQRRQHVIQSMIDYGFLIESQTEEIDK